MHAESNALRQSFVPQPMLRSSWPQLVMFGLGVDSWRERAISEVRGLRDERGPTQLEIYTRTSLSWIPGTRCACPRMTEEKIIPSFLYFYSFLSFPYLLSLSSFPGLTGESVKEILGSSPRMTRKKNALSFERAGSNYSLVIWDIFSLTTAGVYFSTLLSTLREASFSLTLLLSSSPESSSRIRA